MSSKSESNFSFFIDEHFCISCLSKNDSIFPLNLVDLNQQSLKIYSNSMDFNVHEEAHIKFELAEQSYETFAKIIFVQKSIRQDTGKPDLLFFFKFKEDVPDFIVSHYLLSRFERFRTSVA